MLCVVMRCYVDRGEQMFTERPGAEVTLAYWHAPIVRHAGHVYAMLCYAMRRCDTDLCCYAMRCRLQAAGERTVLLRGDAPSVHRLA